MTIPDPSTRSTVGALSIHHPEGEQPVAHTRTPLQERMAGAPISWGICEAPGWGAQLPVDRVLAEMREVGLAATELGAAGWLPTDASAINDVTSSFGLKVIAAFVPLVLHDAAELDAELASARRQAATLRDVGATCFVLCPVSSQAAWERPTLTDAEWDRLCTSIDKVHDIAAEYGLTQVLHPHVDSLTEQVDEVERVLERTRTKVCLDTGHLRIGGADPVAFARRWADRVGLVHLKDVRMDVAERLQRDELTLMGAVQAGVFSPLGQGDLELAEVVRILEASGYDGWYVFEQDAALTDGLPPVGEGPIHDVRVSVDFLKSLAASIG